jgi:hypothetical protein
MARLYYICLRKGLPTEAEQRATMVADGSTAADLADAYVDDCTRRREQPQRDFILPACREGDEVVVARLGVLAATQEDALRFVSALAEWRAVLRDASNGRRYSVRPEAAPDVADALRLAADIAADERAAVMARARSHIRNPTPPERVMDDAARQRAALFWYDQTLTTVEAAARAGFKQRTLYRELGKRHRAGSGPAVTKRRPKRDA